MCVPFDHEFFAVGVPARAFCHDRMSLLPKLLVSNGIHFRLTEFTANYPVLPKISFTRPSLSTFEIEKVT